MNYKTDRKNLATDKDGVEETRCNWTVELEIGTSCKSVKFPAFWVHLLFARKDCPKHPG